MFRGPYICLRAVSMSGGLMVHPWDHKQIWGLSAAVRAVCMFSSCQHTWSLLLHSKAIGIYRVYLRGHHTIQPPNKDLLNHMYYCCQETLGIASLPGCHPYYQGEANTMLYKHCNNTSARSLDYMGLCS